MCVCVCVLAGVCKGGGTSDPWLTAWGPLPTDTGSLGSDATSLGNKGQPVPPLQSAVVMPTHASVDSVQSWLDTLLLSNWLEDKTAQSVRVDLVRVAICYHAHACD